MRSISRGKFFIDVANILHNFLKVRVENTFLSILFLPNDVSERKLFNLSLFHKFFWT